MPREPQLTDPQLAYLRAFEEHLRAHTRSDAERTRLNMVAALAPLLHAAHLAPSGSPRHRSA